MSMRQSFIKWVMNTIAIMLAIKFVRHRLFGEWWGILMSHDLRTRQHGHQTLVKLFTFPLLILTLGLFTFIINAMMLSLTSWLSESFISDFTWRVQAAFWGH